MVGETVSQSSQHRCGHNQIADPVRHEDDYTGWHIDVRIHGCRTAMNALYFIA